MKTKKFQIILLSLICPLAANKAFSQIPSVTSLTLLQTVTYDCKSQVFYSFDEGSDVSQIPDGEKAYLTPTNKIDHGYEYLAVGQKYTKELTHISNSYYSSWMKMPVKTVIDRDGVKSYDENGAVVVNEPRSSKGLDFYNRLVEAAKEKGLFSIPSFRPITQLEIDQMKANGYTVSKDSVGALHMRLDNGETIYNPKYYYIAFIKYDIYNNETYRSEQLFSQNEKKQIVPVTQVEVNSAVTSNGVCYKKIDYTRYDNFTKGGTDLTFNTPIVPIIDQTINNTFAGGIKTYPNPASSVINVELPQANSLDNQSVDISIENVFGKVMQTMKNQVSGTTVTMNVSSLPLDTYVIKVTWKNNGLKTARFLKM
jgi:hypothetical protein